MKGASPRPTSTPRWRAPPPPPTVRPPSSPTPRQQRPTSSRQRMLPRVLGAMGHTQRAKRVWAAVLRAAAHLSPVIAGTQDGQSRGRRVPSAMHVASAAPQDRRDRRDRRALQAHKGRSRAARSPIAAVAASQRMLSTSEGDSPRTNRGQGGRGSAVPGIARRRLWATRAPGRSHNRKGCPGHRNRARRSAPQESRGRTGLPSRSRRYPPAERSRTRHSATWQHSSLHTLPHAARTAPVPASRHRRSGVHCCTP